MASPSLHLYLLLPFLSLIIFSSQNIKFTVCSRPLCPNCSANNNTLSESSPLITAAAEAASFSYYLFAIRWPPSVCAPAKNAGLCRTPVPTVFTIHGLWPQNDKRPHPQYCTDEKFDVKNVESIERDLNIKWPTHFQSNTNENFWAYEWEKHGTCSGLTQLEYFQKSLDLFDDINLLGNLEAIGVVRSDTATYDPTNVVNMYNDKFNVKPRITCVKRGTTEQEMFAEFRFRVNKDAKTVESITGIVTSCRTTSVGFYTKP